MFQLVSDFFRDPQHTVVWASGSVQVVLHTDVRDLKDWVNWNKNRPPDPVRVQAIADYLQLHDVRLVPGLVSIWVDANRTHHVYDGIHRLLAAQQITQQQLAVLVLYRDTTREQDIIDDFLCLNKSISVPSIYLEPSSEAVDQKRRVCVGIVDELCTRYPAFQSASRKPMAYNFNRDTWIEFVSSWNVDFFLPDLQTRVFEAFAELNVQGKAYAEDRLCIPRKCYQHNWFLFYLPRNRIQEHMERIISPAQERST